MLWRLPSGSLRHAPSCNQDAMTQGPLRNVTITSLSTTASGSTEAAGRTFRAFSLTCSNYYFSRSRRRQHSLLSLNYPSCGQLQKYATFVSIKKSTSSSPLLTAGFAKNDLLGITVDAALPGRGGASQRNSKLSIGICAKSTLSWTYWRLPPHTTALNTLRMVTTVSAQWPVSWQGRSDDGERPTENYTFPVSRTALI